MASLLRRITLAIARSLPDSSGLEYSYGVGVDPPIRNCERRCLWAAIQKNVHAEKC